jgi:hypothetical protein
MLKKRIIHLFTIVTISLSLSCKNDHIVDYGKQLKVDFPNNLELINFNQEDGFQDFSNFSVYKLKNFQRDSIIRQVELNLCDSVNNLGDCWVKKENRYTYRVSDSTFKSEYFVIGDIIYNDNYYSLLIIYELKW